MKMLVSVKCIEDDGTLLEEGNFPSEVASQIVFEPDATDLEKANLMLKAFSEITLQIIAKMALEAQAEFEDEIKRHEVPRKIKTIASLNSKRMVKQNKHGKKV